MEKLDKDIYTLLSNSYISYVDIMSLRYCNKYLNSLPLPSFYEVFKHKIYELFELDVNVSMLNVYCSINEYENEKKNIALEFNEIKRNSYGNPRGDPSYYHRNVSNFPLCKRMKKLRYGILHELFKYNVTITGPFLLDCLYNTNNHSIIHNTHGSINDWTLNIFMNLNDHNSFNEYLELSGISSQDKIASNKIYTNKYYLDGNIGNKRCFSITNISNYSITKFVDVHYDLDLHKIQYDGVNLKMINWNQLIYKYDYFTYGNRYIKSITLYEKTGVNLYMKHSESRIQEYNKLGFDIQLHPQIDEMEESIKEITLCNRNNTLTELICIICDILDEYPLI